MKIQTNRYEEATYIDLLRFKAFLEVVLFAFQAVDELVEFFSFLSQSRLIHPIDIQRNDSLLQDRLLLRFQLLFRLFLFSFLQKNVTIPFMATEKPENNTPNCFLRKLICKPISEVEGILIAQFANQATRLTFMMSVIKNLETVGV